MIRTLSRKLAAAGRLSKVNQMTARCFSSPSDTYSDEDFGKSYTQDSPTDPFPVQCSGQGWHRSKRGDVKTGSPILCLRSWGKERDRVLVTGTLLPGNEDQQHAVISENIVRLQRGKKGQKLEAERAEQALQQEERE
ncbi:hypothetical protein MAR_009358 [Mya arenaria]|uniref:39S ribosomal protein L52, mitochondrial n=1 Tax=Mya arenaria TaxID=6604 RepID=A0ABY7E1G7_MYAAR|nr:hypothetical protein MAR_009358 [Mya arenaria]